MPDFSFVLYDRAQFGTTPNVEHILFQVAQGAVATATESATNSRAAGQLPVNEEFEIRKIAITPDANMPQNDAAIWFVNGFFEFRLIDRVVLKAPLKLFVSHAAYSGHFTQATATNAANVGLVGDGFALDIPIVIRGGDNFRPRIFQGTALSAAANIHLLLIGVLRTN